MTTDDEQFIFKNTIPIIHVDAFRIGYDAYKFILDLGLVAPNDRSAQFQMRVIISPDNSKDLTELLLGSIREYDKWYGRIDVNDK